MTAGEGEVGEGGSVSEGPITLFGIPFDDATSVVGRTLAMIEEDCSKTWPDCPRQDELICDCRLRSVRAVNSLKAVFGAESERVLQAFGKRKAP